MSKSTIEWTQMTWNPLTGCNKISPGCKFCYAARMAARLKAMGQANYRNGFDLTLQPQALELPLKWKTPRVVFVNSMSDLFHKDVPTSYIKQVFSVMRAAHWHVFQVLTKRAERLLELSSDLIWPKNVWMGVSVETDQYASRVDCLRRSGAAVKFLSCEPLLSHLGHLDLSGIDWVIAGGESGPGARPMDTGWARHLKLACERQGAAFFMKQLGGVRNKRSDISEFPEDLRIRQMPIELSVSQKS